MFDRFTMHARESVARAYQAAKSFNHDYIGSEHVLLGLIEESAGRAARLLKDLGCDPKKIGKDVEALVSPGSKAVTLLQLPFTPRAKRILELSVEEADLLGQSDIDVEHLLLGTLLEAEGIAGSVLLTAGVDATALRDRVRSLGPRQDDEV
jgi:ATP-dependent Clp protease ATP-binding subunit ClpC